MEDLESAVGLGQHALTERCEIGSGQRLVSERRIACIGREGDMQLREPLAQRVDQRDIHAVDVGGHRHTGFPVLEETDEIVDGQIPAIALIGDETLQERQCEHGAVIGAIFDCARNRHDMRELDDFREEPADLELGVDPRLQAPVRLEEQTIAYLQRRVRALSMRGLHGELRCSSTPERRIGAGPDEANRPVTCAHLAFAADGLDQ